MLANVLIDWEFFASIDQVVRQREIVETSLDIELIQFQFNYQMIIILTKVIDLLTFQCSFYVHQLESQSQDDLVYSESKSTKGMTI